MDDDYNVIGAVDDDQLNYPDQDELDEEQTMVNDMTGQASVLTELNGIDRRPGKRRLCETIEDDSHPIDWHMRMPLTLEEQTSKRYKRLVEEKVLDNITSKILEARLRKSGGTTVKNLELEDFENRGEILKAPPTDGSDWLGVSSDGNEARFYVRLLKQEKALKKLINKERRDDAISGLSHVAKEVLELKMKIIHEQTQQENSDIQEAEIPIVVEELSKSLLWVDKYTPKGYPDLISDDVLL